MAEVTKTYTVSGRGIGRPDYRLTVAKALTRKKLVLEYNEATKLFVLAWSDEVSDFPHVVPPLGIGETQHLIDASTGLPLPFTVPAGYILDILYYSIATNRSIKGYQSVDDELFQEGFIPGNNVYYENEIFAVTTALVDPTASTFHDIDYVAENRELVEETGSTDLYGVCAAVGMLKRVGTPEITTKTVKCRVCGETATVDYLTTEWTCPNGHKNRYVALPFGGGL